MTSFETKCACYAIHRIHKVTVPELAKAIGVSSVLMHSWCHLFDRQTRMKATDIHREEMKLGLVSMYEKYVEGGNNG
jgi:hypothetical protein